MITVSSILIVVIAVFFLVRMFTSNPLEGNWVSEGSELALDIENNERMTVTLPDVVEEQTVEVELQYSLDRDEKTITFKEIPGALASQAESSGGQYTEETCARPSRISPPPFLQRGSGSADPHGERVRRADGICAAVGSTGADRHRVPL